MTIRETFTIPEEIAKQLNKYSERTMVPKSKLISKLLKEFFEKYERI